MTTEQVPSIERARDALRLEAWADAYQALRAVDPVSLAAQDLDGLADAAWWVSRVDESLAARRSAYSAYLAAGERRRAARAAWQLAVEFGFRGDQAVANGWIKRAKRDLEGEPDCVEHGYLAISEAHLAQQRGDLEEALALARQATEYGSRYADPDLTALGIQSQGRLLIGQGKVTEGAALLDEAMTAVITGELSSLVTGWIYCQVVWACLELADLERAGAWSDAAKQWCEKLAEDAPYPGMCRLNRVELITLSGMLAEAEAEAYRASDQLMTYEPYLAGEAFYAIGEVRRRLGDLAGAEQAFGRAHELGREPQPGLALVRLAQDRAMEAARALGLMLAASTTNRLGRARFLAAQVEVALAAGEDGTAAAAGEELEGIAEDFPVPALQATAATASGRILLAQGEVLAALDSLRRACQGWRRLRAPYEAAQAQLLLGRALRAAGDEDSARREFEGARAAFQRLGAVLAAREAAALSRAPSATPGGLTRREVAVLRLVAAGSTNRDIARQLVISEHTVGRHLQNIFAKLGVSSRAAATAFAVEHHLA